MAVKVELKASGNWRYAKVTGPTSDLNKVARQTREPIKAANGLSPEHVDVPERKIRWIRVAVVASVTLVPLACLIITFFI